ncbi:PI-PLC domain-containing protein [Bdellovibrio reynosensis]|uniref:Uncharacterized protein n=1 Tax=Bdellovibrio reynosensis TaxID=2835041 RepID=A0ABY4C9B3_9BACT|nr:hypothetical protein [Bdellovibrio reynosensis]UOF00256.1 hypothetical protein MNR06_11145 [Bdellovibrio reynosensis]
MRIFFITLVSFIVLGVLILMARIWGMGQTFPKFEHAFFNGPAPLIIVKVDTLDKAKQVLAQKSDAILWLDVRLSKERTPYILVASRDQEFLTFKQKQQEENPSAPIFTGGRLSEYTWEQINEFYKTTPALKEFYEQFPTTRFVLNIVDNVSDAHTAIMNTIEGFKPNDRTLIQSDALIIMTSIKELKPQFVYGTSTPDLMRLLSFDSMWILPSTQFKGDVFIAPFTLKKRPAFNDEIIAEMRRRHLRIFLGPIRNQEELTIATRHKAEALITENLSELLLLLGEGPAQ